MPPLWMMFPYIHPYSIGWRMGAGEGYKLDFWDWFQTLPENEQQQYKVMFPPPILWQRNWYNLRGDKDDESYPGGYFPDDVDSFVEFWNKNGVPRYSKDWLSGKNTNTDFVFFWKPGDIEYEPECCFGQWQYSEFTAALAEPVDFTCTEQYMMASKAQIFGDKEIEKEILETRDPKQMKSLGRKVRNFDPKVWDEIKYSIVLNGNYYKFAQNKTMRDILINTGDKVLVEASPLDTIWGIGFAESNPKAADPKSWRGLNLLGFALMEVRDEIKTVYQNYDKIDWPRFEVNFEGKY